jgi:hypothetical protein
MRNSGLGLGTEFRTLWRAAASPPRTNPTTVTASSKRGKMENKA